MTRVVLIALWALLIGFAAANADIPEANAGTVEENPDDTEYCDGPDTSTDAPVTPTGPTLTCGDNEVYDDCPVDCPTDRCPKSEAESQASKYCPQPANYTCPPPQCKCQFNYRRAENGTCIPTRDCPPFECSGKDEEFNSCPPLCPSDDCSQASPSGECPPQLGHILIVLECAPKCRCRKGYWRKNGVCVPYDQCNTPTCGANEILDNCPSNCSSEYCPKSEKEATESKPCTRPDPCPPPACKCRINYRRADNGTCIPTRDCPPFECSRPNEAFNACPPLCPSDDCSQSSLDGTCPKRFGRIGILLICSPKCRCAKGYWRRDGVCVPYADCSEQHCTRPNEEWSLEKPNCPPQECFALTARIDCRNRTSTVVGCACKSGYMRLDPTSPCVRTCDCPQMKYSPECQGKPLDEVENNDE